MLLGNHFHTTYCTNIHPGQDWDTTFDSLRLHLPAIRSEMGASGPFGVGLRLSNKASIELSEHARLAVFKQWLSEHDFYVFTMNGFPYGPFHGTAVKDHVHAPDWTHRERYAYTMRLFEQLSELLPSGLEGGISTSPVSYRHWHTSREKQEKALHAAALHMAEITWKLSQIEEATGQYLHLDIEPEPDGLLENTPEVVSFYNEFLIPGGKDYLKQRFGIVPSKGEALLRHHINLCYDICHFALVYEKPEEVFETLSAEGIRIGKIQVSAALKADLTRVTRAEVLKALRPFDEPVYLHQVRLMKDGEITAYKDLGDYLDQGGDFDELRSHYHVPIFTSEYGSLKSTQDEVLRVLAYLKKHPVCKHLEVETYTWDVLPDGLKEDIDISISRELIWLKEALLK